MDETNEGKTHFGAPPGNKNAQTHGLRAYEAHGSAALDASGLSRQEEIRQMTETHAGLVDLLRLRVVRAEMIAELAESWISRQTTAGVSPERISMLDRVTTYQANAQRAISALMAEVPKRDTVDLDEIRARFGGDNAQNS